MVAQHWRSVSSATKPFDHRRGVERVLDLSLVDALAAIHRPSVHAA
jgi:hypothetical protein